MRSGEGEERGEQLFAYWPLEAWGFKIGGSIPFQNSSAWLGHLCRLTRLKVIFLSRAFFRPRALLSLIKQDYGHVQYSAARSLVSHSTKYKKRYSTSRRHRSYRPASHPLF